MAPTDQWIDPVLLGGLTIYSFEMPECIDRFGGEVLMAVHDMPGPSQGNATRSVQTFGYLPPKNISWEGVFFEQDIAPVATQRYFKFQQLHKAQQPVTLSFNVFSYQVLIHEFYVMPQLVYQIPYFISLVPLKDLSQGAGSSSSVAPSLSSQLASTGSSLAGQIAAAGNLPSSALSNLTNFQASLQNALQQSLSAPLSATNPALVAGLNSAQQSMQQLATNADPSIASTALNLNNTLQIAQNQIKNASAPIATVVQQNPDLRALAAQYYGDANQWTVIAQANPSVKFSPTPSGVFTLTIPPAPSS